MLTWRISFATLESHPEQKGNPLRVRNLRRWYNLNKIKNGKPEGFPFRCFNLAYPVNALTRNM